MEHLFSKQLIVLCLVTIVFFIFIFLKVLYKKDTFKNMYKDDEKNEIHKNPEKNEIHKNPEYSYHKKRLMTRTEKQYFDYIKNSINPSYIVQPQVNLASIIIKVGNFRFQNELFRNIDFGIFDKNYNIVLLIEINDETHFRKDRIERDERVRSIVDSAEIPLITFYPECDMDEEYIKKRINEFLI